MTNMKSDGQIENVKTDFCKSVENSFYDDVPNLGSVITLDNKGRLINSQFSKPSSSQTLLKLNSSEEVPDADDLPYSVISYGDTPNAINLPYNDHNYIGTLSNKNFENYDKKALEYSNKQSIQYSNRSNNFPLPTNLRISHFSNFNTSMSQSEFANSNRTENLFFNEKLKSTNSFNFNPSISSLTPLITANKSINNHAPSNGFLAKKQILSNTIVINSGSVNKLKGMSVIKLQRSGLDNNSIINVPIKKPNLSNVISSETISNEINSNNDKSDKTFNLIPRCVCGFMHDDGGMIRCETCQTWQHIICMYPDNKFPILYKCEKCEPRDIDYNRAISTQTNFLRKMGHNPADYLVSSEYANYESETNSENPLPKQHTPQYVIVQPESKTSYRHPIHDSMHGTPNQIYITNSKDSQLVPPGSPRTSKRKQDLISLKTVLTKSNNNSVPGSITVNNLVIHNGNSIMNNNNSSNNNNNNNINTGSNTSTIINSNNNNNNGINNGNSCSMNIVNSNILSNNITNNIAITNSNINKNHEVQKSLLIDNQLSYNCLPNYHIIPTSTISPALQIEQREPFVVINDMSNKLKSIFSNNKFQAHSNLSTSQEQYLRQHNYNININNNNCRWEFVRIHSNQHVIRSLTELNCNEIIMEYNGFISLSDEYNKEFDFRKHYNPFVLFYEKFDHLSLCIDAKGINSEWKYIRRSCTPNAEVKHKLTPNGQIRFFITPINRISKEMEITIGFDFNYMKCRYPVKCVCNQLSCELDETRLKKTANTSGPIIEYETGIFTGDSIKNIPLMTKPHKKRGRAAKILNTSNRQVIERPLTNDNSSIPVVRRSKRGRPPLNRPNGIQRSDIFVKGSSDSSSNNCIAEYKEASDNESVHCRTNENLNPSLSIHSNFKNFKRISSSHWSLKAHRKHLVNISKVTKASKKYVAPKVGRPLKYKKEKIVLKKDPDFSSDPASSPERYDEREKSYDVHAHMSSNEEYDPSGALYSNGSKLHDLSRDEEGKYWLEEINNKIQKQKMKEAKKVKRKNRIEKKLSRKLPNNKGQNNQYLPPEIKEEPLIDPTEADRSSHHECQEEESVSHEEIDKEVPASPTEIVKDKRNSYSIHCKMKRGRKSVKNNKNYIVSYKTSNIDDLKNDLMLISASLEEEQDLEQEEQETLCHEKENTKNDSLVSDVSAPLETTDEAEKSFNDSFEQKKIVTVTENEYRLSNKFNDSADEKLPTSFKSKYRKSVSNKTKELSKDALKASREERWLNIMWQRILKNENSDTKSKRKRSKSSFADESNPSEENPTECNELSSPKFGDSDFCEDNLSSDNKDVDSSYKASTSSTHKTKRKSNKPKSSSFSDSDKQMQSEKHSISKIMSEPSVDIKIENSTPSVSIEEGDQKPPNEQSNEQCGLIVYKEQQLNPMEKFSRENSAKLFNENYSDGFGISNSLGTQHPPQGKKRWLSQALLEENLIENCAVKSESTLKDSFIERFSVIESNSKHSFLPPVITSVDNSAFSLTPQKVAMNPKKRLLNQFSMEDNAFRISAADIGDYKPSHKWDSHMDQEQSKTKLTLSEYRKRRYFDKSNGNSLDESSSKKLNKMSTGGSEWVGLHEKCSPSPKKDVNIEAGDHVKHLVNVTSDSSCHSKQRSEMKEEPKTDTLQPSALSYWNTLNNLKMPNILDPRLAKSTSLLANMSNNKFQSELQVELNDNNCSNGTFAESCPRSPSKSPISNQDWKINSNERGPRTPSDVDDISLRHNNDTDCLSTYAASQGSIDSFESQPSPTSDSHFEMEKSDVFFKDSKKFSSSSGDLISPGDWTNHSVTIAKMAGIPNPDLLQEIEEFDDEYLPLPENLPERSKEEMETLMLTQKRDSQIREWQEVKQLEREKVKLEHQVRSMQRRMQRANNKNAVDSKVFVANKSLNLFQDASSEQRASLHLSPTNDDEKTMKTFNVQLSNFNDRLIEQINIVKNNNNNGSNKPVKSLATSSSLPPIPVSMSIDLPISYRLNDDKSIDDNPESVVKVKKRVGNDKSIINLPKHVQPNQNETTFIDSGGGVTIHNDVAHFTISNPSIASQQFPDTQQSETNSSISDHIPNFKPLFPELTPAFM